MLSSNYLSNVVFPVCPKLTLSHQLILRGLASQNNFTTFSELEMLVCVYELLLNTKICQEDAMLSLLSYFGKTLGQKAAEIKQALIENKEQVPMVLLGFCDRKFCVLTGSQDIYDLSTQQPIKADRNSFFELLYYNLTKLYISKYANLIVR